MLVQKQENNLHLVPIDHAYILHFQNHPGFELTTDILLHRTLHNVSRGTASAHIMQSSVQLCKTHFVYDIASLICRKKPTEKSDFESMVHSTKDKSEEEVKQVVEELVTSKLSRK